MDEDYGEAVVFYREGNYSEIDGVVGYRFEDLGVVGALDVDRDVGILLFEVGKDFRKDVQAGTFVGAHRGAAVMAPRGTCSISAREVSMALRASRVSWAYFWKDLPAAVRETLPPERSKSLAPTSSSTARIWEEIAG